MWLYTMDTLKISLWLCLVLSSVYSSASKSVNKYLVPNSERSISELDENCFCFKTHGEYKKVPEIMNQDPDNLKRIVVYLYEYKNTGQIKIYVPNREKQALIPDLAFEVGDKLNTIEVSTTVKHIFDRNSEVENSLQDPQIDGEIVILPDAEPVYDWSQKHAQIEIKDDVSVLPSNEILISDSSKAQSIIEDEDPSKLNQIIYVDNVEHNTAPGISQIDSIKIPSSLVLPVEKNLPIDGGIEKSYKYWQNKNNEFDISEIPSNSLFNIPGSSSIISPQENNGPSIPFHPDVQYNTQDNVEHNTAPGISQIDSIKIPSSLVFPAEKNLPIDGGIEKSYKYWLNKNNEFDISEIPSNSLFNIPGSSSIISPQENNGPSIPFHPDVQYNTIPFTHKVVHLDDDETYKDPSKDKASVLNYIIGYDDRHKNQNKPISSEVKFEEIIKPNEPLYIDINNYDPDVNLLKPVVDHMKVISVEQNDPSKIINADAGFSISEQNLLEKYIDDVDKHWQLKVISEPTKTENDPNYIAQDFGIVDYPTDEIDVPVDGQINDWDPQKFTIISDKQSKLKDTILFDKKEGGYWNWNMPSDQVIIERNEQDPNKAAVKIDGQPDAFWNTRYVEEPDGKYYGQRNDPFEHITGYGQRPFIISSGATIPASHSIFPYDLSEATSKVEQESGAVPFILDISSEVMDSNNTYETFDSWFAQQMKRFKTYRELDRTINILTIEQYILKILQDNDMHVTAEGVLADSFGTALDVHKLQLRPILIGNTVALGKLLKERVTELVLPSNMAYLQGILVTNSDPSLMLGIIPIGKTLLPYKTNKAFSDALEPYVLNSVWGKLDQLNSPNNVQSITFMGAKSNYKDNIIAKQGTKIRKGKTIITLVKETPSIIKLRHSFRQPAKTVKVVKTKNSGDHEFVLSEDSAEAMNKLIESIQEGNDPIKSAEATNQLLASLRSGEVSMTSTSKSSEEEDTGGDLSERIVGGNAATSSGVPLSVKGRMKDI